jgi:hypothetical protein
MQIIFFFFFIFYSLVSFAQKSVGREVYMINVKPVVSGILNDFYQMVSLFPDFPKNMVPLIQKVDSLNSDKEILRITCPGLINIKCKSTVNSLRAKLIDIRSISLLLLSEKQHSQTFQINNLSALRIMSDFDSLLEEIKSDLDNSSFLMTAGIHQKKETYYILKSLDELNTYISLGLIEYVPNLYREDFRQFFFNFVNPLQRQISHNTNHDFLYRNLNTLNFSINLLNQTLTKKKKTPEGMGPYLSVIHNRWNSLLRYYY